MQRRDVVVLGSTGSIGTQALDLVRDNPDRFRVVGLTAGGSNPELFEKQVAEFAPAYSGLGEEASTEAAGRACDVVLNGITGAVGLRPTLAALEAGNTLALANKESLIIGGPLVTRLAAPGQIVPVDSEHSALAQCLRGRPRRRGTPARADRVGRPVPGLVGRAAPRRDPRAGARPPDLGHGPGDLGQLRDPGQQGPRGHRGAPALRARLRPDRGRGAPDERRALDGGVRRRLHASCRRARRRCGSRSRWRWPGPTGSRTPPRPWTGRRPETWEFFPLDDDAFPAVGLARAGGSSGGTAPAAYNAANEVCVDAFLAGRLSFADIVPTVREVLEAHAADEGPVPSKAADLTVDDVLAVDAWARERARSTSARP